MMHWIDRKFWPSAWMVLCQIPVHVSGELGVIDNLGPCVFVSNHQSHFDIPATKLALRERMLYFVTKRSLLYIPLVGVYLWRAGYPLVNRHKREQALKAMEQAAQSIRSGGSILIYPEGTRSHDGSIGRFKLGAFVLAIDTQVPIVPLTITGSMDVMHRASLKINPGAIRIHVSKPIFTSGLSHSDRHDLAHKTREIIVRQCAENIAIHSREV